MGTHRVLRRLKGAPLSVRFYQLWNGAVTTFWGRALKIVHVVEYPRCGGTWIRHLLQSALDIPQYAYNRFLTPGTIIQTHALPGMRIRMPIVVVRDPRDALVSFYFKKVYMDPRLRGGRTYQLAGYRHDPNRPAAEDFAAFLAAFLPNPDHPRFSFRDFVESWLAREKICLVRYEDCQADAANQLRRMLEFVGEAVPEEKIRAAVAENSFENRVRRRSGQSRAAGAEDVSQFERKGIVGDWRNLFSPPAAELFLRFEGWTLRRLDYEPNDQWVETVGPPRAKVDQK